MKSHITYIAALLLCGITFALIGAEQAQASTFVVNSTADTSDANPGNAKCETANGNGVCTLRAAIEEANALAGTDTITFNIGSGSPEIDPGSGLPFITTPVTIDGATGGATRVVINGFGAGNSYGLVVGTGSDGSRISSLVISGFGIDGLVLASNVTVQNCYIGTDPTGTSHQGNNNDGIRVDGNNNLIGGTTAGTGNVISGNSNHGVHLIVSASGNQIQGNRIGVNASATLTLSNVTGSGVYLDCSSGNTMTNNTIGGASAGARNIISGNGVSGVHIAGAGATGNFVQGNYIGTDVNGTKSLPNGSNGGVVIDTNAANNTVGGTSAGAGNLISGNKSDGLVVYSATGNTIQGNYIGTDASGANALGNGGNGVLLNNSATNNIIGGTNAAARNIVSGNGGAGIALQRSGTTGNDVQGNYIGTDMNGTSAVGNAGPGVWLDSFASQNNIGATAAGGGNLISANARGLLVTGGAYHNVVQGNLVGTDVSGMRRLGNLAEGVYLNGSANNGPLSGNVVGGASAAAANVISANGTDGVRIEYDPASGNTVAGNFIGTDINGTANLGNKGNGIYVAAPGNTIGGSGMANIIAFNSDRGVTMAGSNAGGNGISQNSIFSNGSIGIDLNNDGVTPNDAGDSDSGPNNLQNYPVLTSATYDSASNTTVVQGMFNSTPGASFTLEFFSSPAADSTLYGEGQTFRGSTSVTTNGVGDVSFSATLNAAVPGGQVITATATDSANNTSEFSKAVLVTGPSTTPTPTASPTPPSQLQNLSTRKQVGTGSNVLIGGFIVVGTDAKKVLLRGLGPSLPVNGALSDPTLELHDSTTGLLAFNDNWREASNASEIAAILPPSNDSESAILTSLAAKPASDGGAGYTGVLAGNGGATGIGLLEIYDLATAANSKLANISTRGFVGTGDDLLIGGFIPGPSDRSPVKVLIRALGPSLTAQSVSDALQDPFLELHDANGTLIANDNWREASNAAEIQATLPPPDDRESAIITTLAPSNSGYTAVVRGANDTTGVALVEVYALQ